MFIIGNNDLNGKKSEGLVILSYISVCIIWGSTYLVMRIAVSNFPPELFAGIRFLLAGILVLLFSILSKKSFPSSIKDFINAALPGIFMLVCTNGLVMYAEQWVHSGIVSLILSTTPLFISVIEFIVFKDNSIGIVGGILLVLGFAGTALIIASGKGIGSIDIKGGLIVLVGSLFWAIGSIYSKRVKCSGHLVTNIGIQMATAGILLSLVGISTGELRKVQVNSNVVLAMIFLVVFGSIVGYSANMFVLSKWPASIAITSAYINPIVAVTLGVIFLKEGINQATVISMVITLGSVVGLHYRKYRNN